MKTSLLIVLSVMALISWTGDKSAIQELPKQVEAAQVATEQVEVVEPLEIENTEPVTTWRDNPNTCDLEKQYVRADNFECKDKPVAKPMPKKLDVEPTFTNPAPIIGADHTGCSEVMKYDWDTRIAYAICQAESGGNPNAYNPESHGSCRGSRGLFQIACVHGANSTFDRTRNVRYAYDLYQRQGWSPWGAYTNGSYGRYL